MELTLKKKGERKTDQEMSLGTSLLFPNPITSAYPLCFPKAPFLALPTPNFNSKKTLADQWLAGDGKESGMKG